MASLANLAVTERTYLREELQWLEAGGKLISPSGDDITKQKIQELKIRLEHYGLAIAEEIKRLEEARDA